MVIWPNVYRWLDSCLEGCDTERAKEILLYINLVTNKMKLKFQNVQTKQNLINELTNTTEKPIHFMRQTVIQQI